MREHPNVRHDERTLSICRSRGGWCAGAPISWSRWGLYCSWPRSPCFVLGLIVVVLWQVWRPLAGFLIFFAVVTCIAIGIGNKKKKDGSSA